MTINDAQLAIEELKKMGNSEEQIAKTLHMMFADDILSLNDLKILLGLVGYELKDDFLKLSHEEQVYIIKSLNDPLKDVVDQLYELCAREVISEIQLKEILIILKIEFNKNYLTRFKVRKNRK